MKKKESHSLTQSDFNPTELRTKGGLSLKIFPISVTLSEIFRIFAVVNNINFTVADGMASQRSAPQRGNEHLAQGSALGDRHKEKRPARAKAFIPLLCFCPFRAIVTPHPLPRVLPWAICSMAFQAALQLELLCIMNYALKSCKP